ncbi:MAG: hypothetical protein A2174_01765 [Candidatus Portnoybacteria bacterium RBG_13_41_18]|uniref:Uncharacterized protein n=1 Tax=Candidatus Portnoybacteria bacterium RBG_13_41_18 TaxID=1801991 RepID=A0A1G2F9C7_9BACT|nr:MAG: hypothetical protein A2174_01765 [Candidatus Portnoybacteria bacterium RBG_13_41_18]
MNFYKKISYPVNYIGLVLISQFFLIQKTFAAPIMDFPRLTEASTIEELLLLLTVWLRDLVIIFIVIVILYSGLLFMTSAGNEEKVTKAKKMLFWALAGLAIVLLSEGILNLIKDFLQVNPNP